MLYVMKKRAAFAVSCCALIAALSVAAQIATRTVAADDLSGLELLRVTRLAQGGSEYSGLQFVTARSQGFVNMAPFASTGLGTNSSAISVAVEVKLNMTDFQDKDIRRRLDVTPTNPVAGKTFLVYTGNESGGMYMGNEFRISETTAARQWALMGFATLNRAADGQFTAARQKDETEGGVRYYVVDVKINSTDTVRYWINQNDFLIGKVMTRYNNKPLVEETRRDYRKVSCMMLPFRIVTRLNNQRVADLTIDNYDLQTVVPSATFTITATP